MEAKAADITSLLLNNIDSLHLRCGPKYKDNQLVQAYIHLQNNEEMKAIYHLTESQAPGLREKALYRFYTAKNVQSKFEKYVKFQCHNTAAINDRVSDLLKHVAELPREWHIVQISSQYNIQDTVKIDQNKYTTNPLHLSVFNCGQSDEKPICLTTGLPIFDNKKVELLQEIKDIQRDTNSYFLDLKNVINGNVKKMSKQYYQDKLISIGVNLQSGVKRMESLWIKEFKCLFVGKYVDDNLEVQISEEIANIIEENKLVQIDIKSKILLYYLMKGFYLLNLKEVGTLLKIIIPNDVDVRVNISRKLRDCTDKYNLKYAKTYPVLLVLDENLDSIPWEQTSMLERQLVTRMPSLHFTFALHKENEETIKNGYKIVKSALNGKYIINPGKNLPAMEMRLTKFFNYWTSSWTGIVGVKPTPKDFEDILTSSNIFMYCGHGSGVQFLPGQAIEKLHINSVVLLFGCKSAGLQTLGPTVEQIGTHYTYLIACSPCILGMLYNVTDFDTDCVNTALLSYILPSTAPVHWEHVDKISWHKTDSFERKNTTVKSREDLKVEKNLLKAFMSAKQQAQYYITKAACISRGLPVKFGD